MGYGGGGGVGPDGDDPSGPASYGGGDEGDPDARDRNAIGGGGSATSASDREGGFGDQGNRNTAAKSGDNRAEEPGVDTEGRNSLGFGGVGTPAARGHPADPSDVGNSVNDFFGSLPGTAVSLAVNAPTLNALTALGVVTGVLSPDTKPATLSGLEAAHTQAGVLSGQLNDMGISVSSASPGDPSGSNGPVSNFLSGGSLVLTPDQIAALEAQAAAKGLNPDAVLALAAVDPVMTLHDATTPAATATNSFNFLSEFLSGLGGETFQQTMEPPGLNDTQGNAVTDGAEGTEEAPASVNLVMALVIGAGLYFVFQTVRRG